MTQLHTTKGIIQVDPAIITDAELAELGLSREWADKKLADEAEGKEIEKLKAILYQDWTSLPTNQVIRIVQRVVKRLMDKGVIP